MIFYFPLPNSFIACSIKFKVAREGSYPFFFMFVKYPWLRPVIRSNLRWLPGCFSSQVMSSDLVMLNLLYIQLFDCHNPQKYTISFEYPNNQ